MILAPIANQWLHLTVVVNLLLIIQVCSEARTNRVRRSSCDSTTCLSGTCVQNVTSGETECECYPGYVEPPLCKDRDECSMVQTLCHNGTCQNTPGSFQCRCNDGYTGKRCTQDFDECKSSPCLNNNTCVNTFGSYHCACYAGYKLPDCRDRDECVTVNNPCNNGTCINTIGSFHCKCHYGYTGKHCTDLDPCISFPCKSGGTCLTSEHGRNYTCQCYAGFNHSSNCDDINECNLSSELCFHGNCQNIPGSYKCVCASGYTGLHCRDQFDHCHSSPCEMGGTCIPQPNGYTCNCSAGFNDSANCVDIDECRLNLANCHNGSCINLMGTYQCFCNAGYQGDRCTEDMDECQGTTNPCPDNTCINTPGSYFCGTDYCITRPCVYGYCRPTVDSYVCECDEGFTGYACDEPASSTLTSPLSSSSSKLTTSFSYNNTGLTTSTMISSPTQTSKVITATKSTRLTTASAGGTEFSNVSNKLSTSAQTRKVTIHTNSSKVVIPTKTTRQTHYTSPDKMATHGAPTKMTDRATSDKMAITSKFITFDTSTVKYQTETQHSTIFNWLTTSKAPYVTTSQQTNTAAVVKNLKIESDKTWVSGHYWIIVIVGVIVVAVGAGTLVLRFKKRKQAIVYKNFGNGSTTSSPTSPTSFYRDNPLYEQIANLNKEGDTRSSTLGNKNEVGMCTTDTAEIKIEVNISSQNRSGGGKSTAWCGNETGMSEA